MSLEKRRKGSAWRTNSYQDLLLWLGCQQCDIISITKSSNVRTSYIATHARVPETGEKGVKIDTEERGRQDCPLSDTILHLERGALS